MVTKEETKAALNAVMVVAEAIRELKSVPSGHLYARLMGHMTFDSYTAIIGTLKNAGLVKEESHLLTWVAP